MPRRRSNAYDIEVVQPIEQIITALGVTWFVLVRESAKDHVAFGKMVRKVLSNLRRFNVPGLEEAMALGVRVFEDPEVRAKLDGLTELRRTGGRPGAAPYGYLFRIDGTWFMFAQVSARATSQSHENDFNSDLAGQIRRLRPTHFGTGPTSRACRHRDHVAMVNLALENKGGPTTKVVCDESAGRALDLRVAADRDAWDDACSAAVNDYHATRRRLSGGAAGNLALGEWTHGEDSLPAGYRFLEPDVFKPVPDLALKRFIADLIAVSSRDHSPEEDSSPRAEWEAAIAAVIEVCDSHGWASAQLKRQNGNDVLFSQARYPDRNVEKLWSYLPLWRSGKYEMRYKLDLGLPEEQTEYMGARLEREIDEHGNTTVHMVNELDFGSFEWDAEEAAVLDEACRRRSLENRPKGRGGRKKGQTYAKTPTLPLLGLSEFEDDVWQYRLAGPRAYRLLRRPVSDATRGGIPVGWLPTENDSVGTVQPVALHEAIATATAQAIEEGALAPSLTRLPLPALAAEERDGRDVLKRELTALSDQIDRLVRKASAFRNQQGDALADGQDEAAADYKRQASGVDDEVRGLRAKLEQLRSPQSTLRNLAAGTTADLGDVAVTLAALARTEHGAPSALHAALALLIVDLRFVASPSAVEFTFSLRLPTSDGAVVIGPISATVPNLYMWNKSERIAEILDLYFLQGWDWLRISAKVVRSAELAHSQIRKFLATEHPNLSAGARTAILHCPIPDTRRIVWNSLTGEGDISDLEDQAWVDHVIDSYREELPGRKTWAAGSYTKRRDALAYVLAHQKDPEEGVLVYDLAAALGLPVWEVATAVDEVTTPNGFGIQPSLERAGAIGWGKRVGKKARVRARLCPWCDTRTATHVLRVPECPDDLICTSCRRMPSDPSIVFPLEYMALWVGGHTRQEIGDDGRTTAVTVAISKLNVPTTWKLRRRRAG